MLMSAGAPISSGVGVPPALTTLAFNAGEKPAPRSALPRPPLGSFRTNPPEELPLHRPAMCRSR